MDEQNFVIQNASTGFSSMWIGLNDRNLFDLMEVRYSSPTGTTENQMTSLARKIALKPSCTRPTVNGLTKAVEGYVTLAARLKLV